mmetsp:Transcript_39775/g.73696  ORF Transcript_39775/g.73696 Transcript_39775/m.73696 type:complete len:724 (-) Transcript_39775:54-2225(-)
MQQALPPLPGFPSGLGLPPAPGGYPAPTPGLPDPFGGSTQPAGYPALPPLGSLAQPGGLPPLGALPQAGTLPAGAQNDLLAQLVAAAQLGTAPSGVLSAAPGGLGALPQYGALPPPGGALPPPGSALPPPGGALPPPPLQDWGQSNSTLAALLGNAAGQTQVQPGADAAAAAAAAAEAHLAQARLSALPHQLATPGPPQMAPPPGLPPPQMAPPGLPPGPLPPGAVPTAPAAVAPSAAAQLAQQDREEREERRRRENRQQAERREKLEEVEKMKCHLHKKVKDSCKFCKKYKEALDRLQNDTQSNKEVKANHADGKPRRKLDRAISEEPDRDGKSGPLELTNTKTFGFSGLLQTHIVECAHFKSLLTLESFDQLIEETYQFANSVEPYMANSGTLPSALFCCLYRFLTLALDGRMLKRLIDSSESPYLRCTGVLYVRYGLPADQLWNWLGEYVLDDEEFKPTPDSDFKTTIGEYVESILSQDKYYNTVLPRLPNSIKRKLEERLAPVGQYRKRTKANKSIIHYYRESGARVEASIDGEWIRGTIDELDETHPARIKVQLRLEDGSEESVHLGKVILAERGRNRSRSRGRRGRSPSVDLSRNKGKSDKELVDELRARDREKAVCSSGKDYARKPVGYKAACALPREQGKASNRLMEEETFVPMSRTGKRLRTPSPDRDFGRRPSAEHQARMQQLFEKYGNVKTAEGPRSASGPDVDRPDVMRLG